MASLLTPLRGEPGYSRAAGRGGKWLLLGLIGFDGGLIPCLGVIESDVESTDNRNDDDDNCRNSGADSPGSAVICLHEGPPFESRLNETLDKFVPEQFSLHQSDGASAHLAPVCNDRIIELIKLRGEEIARLFNQSQEVAVARIERNDQELDISYKFRRHDGFLFPAMGMAEMRRASSARKNCRET